MCVYLYTTYVYISSISVTSFRQVGAGGRRRGGEGNFTTQPSLQNGPLKSPPRLGLTNCEEIAKELNKFFANAVKNLNIPNYENYNSLAENIDDPTLKAIAKWRSHPSILAIASEYKNRANFF